MEQLLLGLVLFNAFFQPSDLKYDTFEIGQLALTPNKKHKLVLKKSLKELRE